MSESPSTNAKPSAGRVAGMWAKELTIVVVGDKKTLAEPLAKVAPVENRDLDGNPLPGGP